MLSLPFYCFAFLLVGATDAFTLSTPSIGSSTVSSRYGPCHQQQLTSHQSIKLGYLSRKPLRLSSTADATPSADDADDEEVEAGKMRVSEIKAELDMRGVAYADCFDKEALEQRLVDARLSGKANPALIDKFNKQRLEDNFEGRTHVDETLSDNDLLNQAVGNDGTLPGGLSPGQFKALIGNPEVMAMLSSPKMQDAMKLMMTGGPGELEKALKDDQELLEMVGKLQGVLGGPANS